MTDSAKPLAGKVALVTGASRGLGFGVARALAREGARVSLSSRSAEAAEAASVKIRQETGAEVIAFADYLAGKGEAGAKDAGKMRLEGKDYVVQEGDVIYFRFNV